MKTTLPKLKARISSVVHANFGGGCNFEYPFWLNRNIINMYRSELYNVIEEGKKNPTKRFEVTPAQQNSLEKWINDMDRKFVK